jgi:hypothetical protein
MCFISTAARPCTAMPLSNCRRDRFHPEKKMLLA